MSLFGVGGRGKRNWFPRYLKKCNLALRGESVHLLSSRSKTSIKDMDSSDWKARVETG